MSALVALSLLMLPSKRDEVWLLLTYCSVSRLFAAQAGAQIKRVLLRPRSQSQSVGLRFFIVAHSQPDVCKRASTCSGSCERQPGNILCCHASWCWIVTKAVRMRLITLVWQPQVATGMYEDICHLCLSY